VIRDPESGIRNKPIPDPGSRGQKGTQSRIPDPDPQHCLTGGVGRGKPGGTWDCVLQYLAHVETNDELVDTNHDVDDGGPGLVRELARLPDIVVSPLAIGMDPYSSSYLHRLHRLLANGGFTLRVPASPNTIELLKK